MANNANSQLNTPELTIISFVFQINLVISHSNKFDKPDHEL